MSAPNGYGTEPAWEHRGRKKKDVSPEEPPAATASVSPAASVSSPTPDDVGAGTISDKTTGIDPRFIVGVSLAIIGLVVLFIVLSVSTATTEAENQTPPVPVSTAIPTATTGETSIAMVDQLIAEGEYSAAARMAEKALESAPLTANERTDLQEKALAANLQALLSEHIAPLNVTAQQQQVNRYRYLQQQAADAGVPFPSTLAIAQRAKAAQQYFLAKYLYETAYSAGEFGLTDDTTVRQYIDVLFHLGWWRARATDDTIRQEGLRFLSASHALDIQQGTAPGGAWAELRNLLGANENSWPPPAETPLLTDQ